MSRNKPPLIETLSWIEASNEKEYVQQSVLEKLENSELDKARKARRESSKQVKHGVPDNHQNSSSYFENYCGTNLSSALERPTISKTKQASWKFFLSSTRSAVSNFTTVTAASSTVNTPEKEEELLETAPINILCLDGGGSKGNLV